MWCCILPDLKCYNSEEWKKICKSEKKLRPYEFYSSLNDELNMSQSLGIIRLDPDI